MNAMRRVAERTALRPAALLAGTLLAASAVGLAPASEPYAVGDRIAAVTLEDQHGVERAVDESVALVLFARDMDAGDIVKQALAETDGEALAARHAVYVADISAMPGLVARMFALPRMRKRAYPMLLDRDGVATERFPAREGVVTLMRLDDLELEAVEFVADPAALAATLGARPAGSATNADAPARPKP